MKSNTHFSAEAKLTLWECLRLMLGRRLEILITVPDGHPLPEGCSVAFAVVSRPAPQQPADGAALATRPTPDEPPSPELTTDEADVLTSLDGAEGLARGLGRPGRRELSGALSPNNTTGGQGNSFERAQGPQVRTPGSLSVWVFREAVSFTEGMAQGEGCPVQCESVISISLIG